MYVCERNSGLVFRAMHVQRSKEVPASLRGCRGSSVWLTVMTSRMTRMILCCMQVIKSKGLEQISVEDLVAEITPRGTSPLRPLLPFPSPPSLDPPSDNGAATSRRTRASVPLFSCLNKPMCIQ